MMVGMSFVSPSSCSETSFVYSFPLFNSELVSRWKHYNLSDGLIQSVCGLSLWQRLIRSGPWQAQRHKHALFLITLVFLMCVWCHGENKRIILVRTQCFLCPMSVYKLHVCSNYNCIHAFLVIIFFKCKMHGIAQSENCMNYLFCVSEFMKKINPSKWKNDPVLLLQKCQFIILSWISHETPFIGFSTYSEHQNEHLCVCITFIRHVSHTSWGLKVVKCLVCPPGFTDVSCISIERERELQLPDQTQSPSVQSS